MRKSPKRHPLAVLRLIFGWDQQRMADELDISRQAVQKIELCERPLTSGLAERITEKTGVSYDWLMAGNPKVMPSVQSDPLTEYTREQYDKHGAAQLILGQNPATFILKEASGVAVRLLAILARVAVERKGERAPLAIFKINRELAKLAAEFCPGVNSGDFTSELWTKLDNDIGEAMSKHLERLLNEPVKPGWQLRSERLKAQSKTKPSRSPGSQRRGNS